MQLDRSPITVHLAVIGHGKVGSEFIDQVIESAELICLRKQINLRIFAIANSKRCLFSSDGIGRGWRELIAQSPIEGDIPGAIIAYAHTQGLDNLIAVDNTSSEGIARSYRQFVEAGFDLVSSNKKANTLPWSDYLALRLCLYEHGRSYRYETNVGAGLPLIDNIKLLHLSGERIHRIRGVFSGSLSYIFNELGRRPTSDLRQIIQEATDLGYAEPDVREDLSGEDVARKLLILARELDIEWSLEHVLADNIVPEELRTLPVEEFWAHFDAFEQYIQSRRAQCPPGHVLRYIGEVVWDDETECASLKAGLEAVPEVSTLGALSSADCCFQIFTESYGSRPVTIQGAGAGTKVTARGVFGDVLRLCEGYLVP